MKEFPFSHLTGALIGKEKEVVEYWGIRNVFSVIRELLLFSIPPIPDTGAIGIPELILYPNWSQLVFDAAKLEVLSIKLNFVKNRWRQWYLLYHFISYNCEQHSFCSTATV